MPGLTEQNLASLGIVLPRPVAPVANFVATVLENRTLYVSGQIPVQDGKLLFPGRLGENVTLEQAQEAAAIAVLNVVAHVKSALGDDLDRVERCIRLGVFVAATREYVDHPKVANGASDMIVKIFGDRGKHVRAAVGVNSLPFGVCVEVDAVFAVRAG